jgi:hypothetical protein
MGRTLKRDVTFPLFGTMCGSARLVYSMIAAASAALTMCEDVD